jgi:hypothetical protein
MKYTITQWIIKLLQFELSYKTLKLATLVYFGLFFTAYIICIAYLFTSAVRQEPVNVLHIGAFGVVAHGTKKISRLKIFRKR